MNDALNYVISFVLQIVSFLFVARFLLQACRVDFYNPVSQGIVKITDPILRPLRVVLPGFRNLDFAAFLAAVLSEIILIMSLTALQGGYAGDEYAYLGIMRRNVEGGPRRWQMGHTNSRILGGVRGDIDDTWSYDLYWLRAESELRDSFSNDLSVQRMLHALDVIEDPGTGEWVCRDHEACVSGPVARPSSLARAR